MPEARCRRFCRGMWGRRNARDALVLQRLISSAKLARDRFYYVNNTFWYFGVINLSPGGPAAAAASCRNAHEWCCCASDC